MVRCSSLMEAPLSASNRLYGASDWTEVTGMEGLLLLEGGRPPDSGTFEGSGAVSGLEPDLEPWGGFIPFTPGVWEVALRRLQDHLLPAWNLLGQHFGVVRRAGGGSRRKRVHIRRVQ